MPTEASHYRKLKDRKVQCLLCPHSCLLDLGASGTCRVRRNLDGILYTYTYGALSGMAIDPVEKKPLYHFLPGTGILSLGSFGCTMNCLHCQNEHISQRGYETAENVQVTPVEAVVQRTIQSGVPSIAYTYNEPVVYYEFMRDVASQARERGLYNVVVTNGFIQPEPLKELLPFIDAMNVDLKAFNDTFYKKVCSAGLSHVLRALDLIQASGTYFELTFLVIEDLNDDPSDFDRMTDHIAAKYGSQCVLHISRYFPRYKLSNPPTRVETIERFIETAKKKLHYVYAGNTGSARYSDTHCPSCGALLIERRHYNASVKAIRDGCCMGCGHPIHGKFHTYERNT
jgi:pyruvate formate lyase activating enzyme